MVPPRAIPNAPSGQQSLDDQIKMYNKQGSLKTITDENIKKPHPLSSVG
jgi:hypothetical protein